jgi:hypothetical protein
MTPQSRNRLILLVLLGVLGITLAQAFKSRTPETAGATQGAASASTKEIPSVAEGRIRLDWIDPESPSERVGRKNLFQYRTAPVAPVVSSSEPPRPVFTPPPSFPPPRPAGPPPPPPILLKYEGYAVTVDGSYTAFLSDDAQHYNVKVGDVLIGRFRILQIMEAAVEVEDLQSNRRQTLPIVKLPKPPS